MKTITFNKKKHHNIGVNYRRVLLAVAFAALAFEEAGSYPNRGFKKTSRTRFDVKVVYWNQHNIYYFTLVDKTGMELYFYITPLQLLQVVEDLMQLEEWLCASTI